MTFPIGQIPTEPLFNNPVAYDDLGSITRGLFTKYKRIKIDSLHPRQPTVDGATLNYKMKGKGFTVPMVVLTKTGNILIDGHHTVVVKKLKGQKIILANCYELT